MRVISVICCYEETNFKFNWRFYIFIFSFRNKGFIFIFELVILGCNWKVRILFVLFFFKYNWKYNFFIC